jgi:hypothetical protein
VTRQPRVEEIGGASISRRRNRAGWLGRRVCAARGRRSALTPN